MRDPSIIGWAVLLFTSIAWYAFLVFYIGLKAGKELRALIRHLTARQAAHRRSQHDGSSSP